MEDHGKNILDFPLKEVPSKLKEYQEYMGLNPHGSSITGIPGMQQAGSGGTLGGLTGTYIPIPTTTFPGAYASPFPKYTNADVDWNMWVWTFRVDDKGYLDATATCRECGEAISLSACGTSHVPSCLAEHKCNGGIVLIPGK